MKTAKKFFTIITAVLVCVVLVIPYDASAQSTSNRSGRTYQRNYDRSQWNTWYREWQRNQAQDEDVEADDEEVEQVTSRRRYSSAIQNKIDNLDDDKVEDLPIPVLFGVAKSDLFPNFGDERDGGARTHEGEDILGILGTPIVSPTEAVVLKTGTGDSSGKYVYTANPGGETFVYMHLSEIADIDEGDELNVGDIIGYVGDTGNAKGGPAHLHFEIRDGREPTDPFPRLTTVFSPKDKIEYLENALNDVVDEDDFAEFMVKNFSGELLAAKSLGYDLPDEIEDEFPDTLTTIPTVNLSQGSTGNAVIWLQQKLIATNTGAAAKALAGAGATGTFGPLTKAALIEYQLANGIAPAAGYFGPITRTYMSTH